VVWGGWGFGVVSLVESAGSAGSAELAGSMGPVGPRFGGSVDGDAARPRPRPRDLGLGFGLGLGSTRAVEEGALGSGWGVLWVWVSGWVWRVDSGCCLVPGLVSRVLVFRRRVAMVGGGLRCRGAGYGGWGGGLGCARRWWRVVWCGGSGGVPGRRVRMRSDLTRCGSGARRAAAA
jgi:hypothetical protein